MPFSARCPELSTAGTQLTGKREKRLERPGHKITVEVVYAGAQTARRAGVRLRRTCTRETIPLS